jgi:hypothetical protein
MLGDPSLGHLIPTPSISQDYGDNTENMGCEQQKEKCDWSCKCQLCFAETIYYTQSTFT